MNHQSAQAGFIRASAIALAAASLLVACGPQQFAGASAFTIAGGKAPPPEPEAPKRVEVQDNKIVIREKIQFEVDKAIIKQESYGLMEEIGQTIRNNPQIKKLRIEGHASSEGSDKHNLDLSDRRAKAVMEHLVSVNGIEAARLVAKGYGETQPIASNESEEGREKNRRVEFTILDQEVTTTKYEVDPKTGEKRVIEQQTNPQNSR